MECTGQAWALLLLPGVCLRRRPASSNGREVCYEVVGFMFASKACLISLRPVTVVAAHSNSLQAPSLNSTCWAASIENVLAPRHRG